MSNWEPLPTPNPAEFAIRVWASPQQVLSKMGSLVAGTTTLNDFDMGMAAKSEGIGAYVYVKPSGMRDDGYMGFVFAKLNADPTTPFRTWTEAGNHYWHPILRKVAFFQDRGFPKATTGKNGGTVVAPRLYDRIDMTPSMSEGTLFTHRLYLKPTPRDIKQPQVPTPRAVSWSYHDSNGSVPECIGPQLVFPPIQSAFASYTSGGGTVDAFGAANGQIYPATDMEEWESYIVSDKQEELEVGWLRHEIEVTPPDQPESVRS